MGDRGNIVIDYGKGKKIYFYTHWKGSDIRAILYRALARKQRWDDPAYLARIIFSELIRGDEGGETGYGIAPYEIDNEHPLLIVDTVNRRVKEGKKTVSFDDFLFEGVEP